MAKDWKVETQKEHFPHYFFLDNIETTLNYQGVIPAYTYFEKKRTTLKDYEGMQEIFKTKAWNFLEVSKEYIKGDCIALFEILIAFFNTLKSKFPINPLQVLSAPSTSFKIWRTKQLPILHSYNQKVYDLSRNYDEKFRESYLGGIVDVYKPHLIGKGYYYDVNSLYPSAMCQPMPVGMPQLLDLTIEEFLKGDFFGFVKATVKASCPSTPSGYIGLLSIKY